MSAIRYRPEIDGLRAVAVVPVILFHLGVGAIPGGFLGVDVFFVISGFLITSIITSELQSGTFSLKRFWIRRIRRIVPALVVMIATSLIFGKFLISRIYLQIAGENALASLVSIANIIYWRRSENYWAVESEHNIFLHTWSLSVEEQFYFFFPILIYSVYRFRPQCLRQLLVVVLIASYAIFLLGSRRSPAATFYLLPTRIWELTSGAILALTVSKSNQTYIKRDYASFLSILGLGVIVFCFFAVKDLGPLVALVVMGACLIIQFAENGPCNYLLTRKPLMFVGKISYSFYLWHWPVISIAKLSESELHGSVLLLIISLLSAISYFLVEKPFTKGRAKLSTLALFYTTTIFLAFSVMVYGVYDTSAFNPSEFSSTYYNLHPNENVIVGKGYSGPEHVAPRDAYKSGGIISGKPHGNPEVVVLGDSHGAMWSKGIQSVVDRMELKTSFWVIAGVNPFVNLPLSHNQFAYRMSPSEKYDYDESRLSMIKQWHPKVVIICSRWASIAANTESFQLNDLLSFLEQNAGTVLLMEQPPELKMESTNILQYLCFKAIQPNEGTRHYLPVGNAVNHQKGRELVRKLSKSYKNIDVIPTSDLYMKNDGVLALDGKNVLYVDDDHITTAGSMIAIGRIEEKLKKALGDQK